MKKALKTIAITIGVFFICAFSWLFYHSKQQNTSLLHELATQITRFDAAHKYKNEAAFARSLLKTILGNEQPPEIWQNLVGPRTNDFGTDRVFYFFKVWFTESGTTLQDIEKSYPVFAFTGDNKIRFDLRYGKSQPTIQFTITTDQEKHMKADFVFPLNNCLFDPDYNNDKKWDLQDVRLAKENPQRKPSG